MRPHPGPLPEGAGERTLPLIPGEGRDEGEMRAKYLENTPPPRDEWAGVIRVPGILCTGLLI